MTRIPKPLGLNELRFEDESINLYDLIKTLTMIISYKDRITHRHSIHVSRYSVLIGQRMGLSKPQIEALRQASLLHDIGKVSIPDKILLKPEKLTHREFHLIRKHPEIGAKILASAAEFGSIIPAVLHHHERYDGKGYPHGIKATEIPVEARIIAVADSFEAMTGHRPYREAFSSERAIAELKQNIGSQFDPSVAEVFVDILEKEIIF